MGWCSFILFLVATMPHVNSSSSPSTPLDNSTNYMNLNESPNDPLSLEPGIQMVKKRKRILGGIQYRPPRLFCTESADNWPVPDWEHWTASIKIKKSTQSEMCGGALITVNHVLSALHCIKDPNTGFVGLKDVQIFFDVKRVELFKDTPGFTPIGFYHKRMGFPTVELLGGLTKDDILLIKLNVWVNDPILGNPELRPIPRSVEYAMETVKKDDGSNNFWLAGWGGVSVQNKKLAQFLQYTNELDSMTCPRSPDRQDSHICFKSTNTDAACSGDSGSPGVVGIHNTGSSKRVWHLQSINIRAHDCTKLTAGDHSVHIDIHKYKTEIDQWMNL